VETCQSGEEALKKMGNFNPDLLLLDILLPGISGLEVLRVIRENSMTRNFKIVLFSAQHESNFMSEAKADGFLRKPFSKEQLFETLDNVLLRDDE
jgi:CheY-like chemotaxis protein